MLLRAAGREMEIKMKKFLSLLIAMLLLLSVVFTTSCSKDEDTTEETSSVVTTAPTENEAERLDVPEDIDYGKSKFTVLGCANWGVDEFSTEEVDMGNAVESAIVQRDLYVEDYLGVDLDIVRIGSGSQYNSRGDFVTAVENSVSAGSSDAYDLIACYSMVAPSLATRGVLVDLESTEYYDSSKAWWPVYMSDVCTVNGKTYHISGDASVNLLYYLQGVLFDSEQMAIYKISEDEIYDIVRNGGWTVELMLEYSKNISHSNDATWDDSDFYAIGMESNVMLNNFYYSTGLSTVTEENGVIKVSDDILSEKTLNLYDMVYQAVYVDNKIRIPDDSRIVNLLKEGRCIFNISTIYQMRTTLAETEGIGVLPFPKYEVKEGESNLGYRTLVANPHTQFCIPLNAADSNKSSAVLETLGYSSYTLVTPTVFENVMKLRYSKDTNAAEMFDILRSGATTEIGVLWYDSFDKDPQSMFRNAIVRGDTNWVSNYKGNYEASMKSAVIELNKFYMQ